MEYKKLLIETAEKMVFSWRIGFIKVLVIANLSKTHLLCVHTKLKKS